MAENPSGDLRRLGHTASVGRSPVDQVRAHIERLRAQRDDKSRGAATYDFEARLRQIAEEQDKAKLARREAKRAEKEATQKTRQEELNEGGLDQDAMAMVRFASFESAGMKR